MTRVTAAPASTAIADVATSASADPTNTAHLVRASADSVRVASWSCRPARRRRSRRTSSRESSSPSAIIARPAGRAARPLGQSRKRVHVFDLEVRERGHHLDLPVRRTPRPSSTCRTCRGIERAVGADLWRPRRATAARRAASCRTTAATRTWTSRTASNANFRPLNGAPSQYCALDCKVLLD